MASSSSNVDFEARIALHELKSRSISSHYPNINDIDLAASILSHILAGPFLAARRPVDREFTSIENCIILLSTKPELHETLKLAHAEKDYTRFMSTEADRSTAFIPPFVSVDARSYLESFRPEMERLVGTDDILTRWVPEPKLNLDEATLLHIESLKLCGPQRSNPDLSIILHDLGTFKNDRVLKARTAKIFTKQNKFLVNTSGTGKTRLLYEGLCMNWGFYFTVVVEDLGLGSIDIQAAVTRCSYDTGFTKFPKLGMPEASEQMKRNSEIAQHRFNTVLLARLLVFQIFLEIASRSTSGITEEHKSRWLLIQLSPKRINPTDYLEPFDRLAQILEQHDSTYLRENIADALRKIRKLLGDDVHLFFVMDEAQVAIEHFRGAFPDSKPLLPEIVRAWADHMTDDQTFVFAGTDIPKALFDDGDSGSSKYGWCSGTGRFDDPEAQQSYVSRFLPPALSNSPSGRFLISRIWRWLRGRHRSTASFMYALLNEGFKTPHSRLNHYIKEATGLEPLDAVEQVREEGRDPNGHWKNAFHTLDFSKLPIGWKAVFSEILLQYVATHQPFPPFGPEHIKMVNEGYALCVDTELSRIVIDEPLFLVGGARVLFPHPSSRPWEEIYPPGRANNYPETFVGSMRLNVPQTPQALSHCFVFYLARVFSQPRPLAAVFAFPHKVPAWAKQSAQLIKFHRDESEVRHSVVSHDDLSPLATSASSLKETVTWLEHQYGTAFCLPSSSSSDLLFALKLTDESFIWVAVHAFPLTDQIPDSDLKKAISQLAPDSLFTDKVCHSLEIKESRAISALHALPQRSSKLGKHSVLRVACAFPAKINLEPCVTKQSRDVASLSLTALEGAEDEVSQPEFFDAI
ncbi:hypothetical protein DFH09DRAFT_961522, partial [Mycena vulgaris]